MNEAVINMVMTAVNNQVDNDLYRKGIMRLGAFIEALKKCDQEKSIRFDFYGFVPTELDSYRGYYDHLAFAFSERGNKKVSEVLTMCEEAMGQTFTGYKGG